MPFAPTVISARPCPFSPNAFIGAPELFHMACISSTLNLSLNQSPAELSKSLKCDLLEVAALGRRAPIFVHMSTTTMAMSSLKFILIYNSRCNLDTE